MERAVLLGSGGEMPTGRRETCSALLRQGDRALAAARAEFAQTMLGEDGLDVIARSG